MRQHQGDDCRRHIVVGTFGHDDRIRVRHDQNLVVGLARQCPDHIVGRHFRRIDHPQQRLNFRPLCHKQFDIGHLVNADDEARQRQHLLADQKRALGVHVLAHRDAGGDFAIGDVPDPIASRAIDPLDNPGEATGICTGAIFRNLDCESFAPMDDLWAR